MKEDSKTKRIGAVSRQLNIPTYVLRYWETEFPELKPQKTPTGQRMYTEEDVAIVKKIARLRYDEKVTLKGTREKLKDPNPLVNKATESEQLKKSLKIIKNSLQEILEALG